MANFTTNYELTKPLATELYDIEVQNDNMEKIDVALGNKSEKIAYSTEEVLTGDTWIDDKPIYRRVITGNVTKIDTGLVLNEGSLIENLGTVVDVRGMLTMSDTGTQIPTYYTYYTDAGRIQDVVIGVRPNGEVYINSYNTGSVIIIVEYTKI